MINNGKDVSSNIEPYDARFVESLRFCSLNAVASLEELVFQSSQRHSVVCAHVSSHCRVVMSTSLQPFSEEVSGNLLSCISGQTNVCIRKGLLD